MDFLKKNVFNLVVFFGWIITSYITFIAQNDIYGGVIESMWIYILVMVPSIVIADFMLDKKERKEKTKLSKVLDVVYVGILAVVSIFLIRQVPNNVVMVNFLFISIMWLVVTIYQPINQKLKNRKNLIERSVFMLIIYTVLSLSPFILAGIYGIKSTGDIKAILIENGYTNTEYVYKMEDIEDVNYFFNEDLIKTENHDFGYYIFESENDSEKTAICVDVISAEIISSIEIEKDSAIEFFVNTLH